MEKHQLLPLFSNGGLYTEISHSAKEIKTAAHPRDKAHIHDFCEIYLNIRGSVSFAVENKIYSVESGDMIITKPNEIHYCIYHTDGIHECYCFWIKAEEEFLSLLSPFLEREKGEQNLIRPKNEDRRQMTGFLDTALAEQDAGSIAKISAVMNVLSLLDRYKNETHAAMELPPILHQILSYIDAHFSSDCSVKKLCEVFFISRSTVNRLFRSYLNTTPARYLENRRLANAKILLKDKESVQNVCEKCGFPDYSHFIALFKKRFGITPYQYQKANDKPLFHA